MCKTSGRAGGHVAAVGRNRVYAVGTEIGGYVGVPFQTLVVRMIDYDCGRIGGMTSGKVD